MTRTADVSTLRLKKGTAKPLHSGHPWVFADAVAGIDGTADAGAEVRVVDDKGSCLGRGFYSPKAGIAVRMVTRDDVQVTNELLHERVDHALKLRHALLGLGGASAKDAATTAYRLINSEGDGLPGLTVDVYGDHLSVQIGTAGIERRLDTLLDALESRLQPKGILDRSDARIRQLEKLSPPRVTALRGAVPDAVFFVRENGIELTCDLRPGAGQKTGLYVDQRENRAAFAQYATGREVLDVFSYSGGFSLYAARAKAKSLTLVESSEEALEMARLNLERNGVTDADLVNAPWTDGFRHLREQKRSFDLIVVDPPKFARSREQLSQALSGYRDVNAQAVRLLRPGGILFTCSCSGIVDETEYERTIAGAVRSAGRRGTVLERRGAGRDHPTPPGFEQGRYLKCLVLQVE